MKQYKLTELPLDVEAMSQARQFSESACVECVGLSELCPACQDLRDTRDAEIAHQLVDEGNLQYKFVWSQTNSEVSGHDWVSSVQRISDTKKRIRVVGEWDNEQVVVEEIDGQDRDEFLDPISVLTDRMYDLESSLIITPAEVICETCHLVFNKWSICPNCN
jgi:hypothetical protein